MPTIEERLQTIEQEHAQLKKTIELQTIAIRALVNKSTLERLNERYDKFFEALIAHDELTNQQLAELREQHITNIETILAQILARLPENPSQS